MKADKHQKQDIGTVEDLSTTENVDFEGIQSGAPGPASVDEFEVNLEDDSCSDIPLGPNDQLNEGGTERKGPQATQQCAQGVVLDQARLILRRL